MKRFQRIPALSAATGGRSSQPANLRALRRIESVIAATPPARHTPGRLAPIDPPLGADHATMRPVRTTEEAGHGS